MRIASLLLIMSLVFFWPLYGSAEAEERHDQLFLPSSAWLVGSSSILPAGAGVPCIMMNQYNNGILVRISGGGEKIMAMAIDFQKDFFEAGGSYQIGLAIPSADFSQDVVVKAFDRQTLLFNTQDYSGLYQALKTSKVLELHMGKQKLSFAMIGMDDGFMRLEKCYGVASAQESKKRSEGTTEEGGNIPRAEDIAKSWKKPPVEAVPLDPPVFEGSSVYGSSAKATPLGDIVEQIDEAALAITSDMEGADTEGSVMRWRALKGNDLHDVLNNWASHANVKVLWMAGNSFSVEKSMVIQAGFEEAVLELLEQYNGKSPYPVGHIYNDMSSNQKILLIEDR